MLRFSILEYGRIPRSGLTDRLLLHLQRFDESSARSSGETMFDWSHLHFIKAKSFVGVLQIPGLQIEILPKIDRQVDVEAPPIGSQQIARQNLLYMLSVAGRIPLHERDLAGQIVRCLPLWEALISVFARRLLAELRQGLQHLYVYREENLPYVKGRILMSQQVVRNTARRHLLYSGHDEFVADTWLNRIFKAACSRLLAATSVGVTQQALREALFELADVEACPITPETFDAVRFNRGSERFRDMIEFCRLLLFGTTPSPESGGTSSFSLFVPMETLFEEFVGRFLKKNSDIFGYSRMHVHLQAESRRQWLLRDGEGRGKFRLKPDILCEDDSANVTLIVDTKWKHVVSDDMDSKNGVAQSDVYQLYAYSRRYHCADCVLLFPKVEGVTPKSYVADGEVSPSRLRIEFVDLSYDLRQNRSRLIENLQQVVGTISGGGK